MQRRRSVYRASLAQFLNSRRRSRRIAHRIAVDKGGRMTPRPYVRATGTDEALVLLNIKTSTMLRCNRLGAHVWQRLVDGVAVDVIVDTLAQTHSVPRERVHADVVAFVQELQSHDLIA